MLQSTQLTRHYSIYTLALCLSDVSCCIHHVTVLSRYQRDIKDIKVKEYVAALHRSETSVRRPRGIPTPPANDVRRSGGHPTDMDAICDDVRSPGSFGGIRNLKRHSGRSECEVKTFLSGRDAYTLHKPIKIRFPCRKTYSKGIVDLYQIDLADLSNISWCNDGARYLLTSLERRLGQYPFERRPVAKSRTPSRRYWSTVHPTWFRAIREPSF